MKRYKRFLVILLLLAMVIPVFYYPEIAFADDNRIRIEKLNGKQYLVFNVSATQSTARYRYRTKGWNIKAKFDNGYSKNFYFDSFEFTETATGNQVSMLLEEVLTAGGISRETLAYGGSLEVGARQVILVDGRETSPVYNEQGDIIYAIKARYGIEWSQQTQSDLMTYHGLKLYFDPPIPDPDPEPTANFDIIHNGLVKTNNTTPIMVENLPSISLQDKSIISMGSISDWEWSIWENREWVHISSSQNPTFQIKDNLTYFQLKVTSDKGKTSSVTNSINFAIGREDEAIITVEVKPDPKEKKFEGKDIEVILSVKGDLNNYSDKTNISRWIFYAKHKGEPDSKYQTKVVYSNNLSESNKIKFTIPASKVTGDEFVQEYDVKVKVEFKRQVDGDWFLEGKKATSATVYKQDKPKAEEPEEAGVGNLPPVAVIIAPFETVVGATEVIIDGSYDPDGYIVERYWHHTASGTLNDNVTYGDLTFNKVGTYTISLVVIDDKGAGAMAEHTINVIPPPPPVASLKISGILKQNRKVEMENTSTSHYLNPIDPSKTVIEIIPTDHGATEDIRYSGTLADEKIKNLTFKDSGTYKFKITVTNTANLSNTREYIKYIQPDMPPFVDFNRIPEIYRDPKNSNLAKIELTDHSFSPDGDPITERIWKIKYNSTNNKNADGTNNFSDDPALEIKDSELNLLVEKTYNHNGVSYKVIKTAEDKLNIKVNQIGAYLIDLEVIEGIGQDFIPEHIGPNDFSRGDTSHKHHFEKTIKVLNRAPTVNFN